MSGALALSILGGGGASYSGGDAASAVVALRRASAAGAEAKGVARLAQDPSVKQALARFVEGISRARDVGTALRDPRVAAVLLPALGLPDAVGMPGIVERALTSDPSDPKSVAARLPDARWKAAAATLNLSARGMDALRDPVVQKKLTDGYVAYQWRVSQNDQAGGVSDALYFQERVATGKPLSVWEVLGDSVLRRVVTGALGLPDAMAVQSVEAQARAVTARLDLSKLTDAKGAAKLAERYVMAVAGTSSGSSGGASLLQLFA
jgi:hypothetical protein